MMGWRLGWFGVTWIAIFLFVPRVEGFPGMKRAGVSDQGGQPGETAGAPEGPLPGGTPPPATVSGIRSLFENHPPVSPLPVSGPGTLSGQVTDSVSDSPVLAGLQVSLAVVRDDKVVAEQQAETGEDGGFVFDHLATDPALSYAVAVIYQGVRYAPAPVSFPKGGETVRVEVPVYPSGPAPGKARVKGSHLILSSMGDAAQVTEMIFIENPDQKALVGSAEGIVTLAMELPRTASHLRVEQGFQRDHISVGDGVLYYDGPLYPGTNQVVISYQIRPATGWTFRRTMDMPVDMFDVFVKAAALSIESPMLGSGESLDMRGTPFVRYHGGPFDAGTSLTFAVAPASGVAAASGASQASAVPIAVMVALFVSFFVALPLLRPSAPPVPSGDSAGTLRRELEAERDRHLLAVADLDLDYQAGKLHEEEYRQLRERHKSAAVKVMQRLDAIASSGRQGEGAGTTDTAHQTPASSGSSGPADQEGARFCTQCGHRLDPGDRFCARCGTRVKPASG